MGRNFTASDLITRVRKLGSLENLDGDYSGDSPEQPSSGTLLNFMDVAVAHAWELWSDSDENWNLTRQTQTLSPGVNTYTLPSDIHRLRAVELSVDTSTPVQGYVPLERADIDDDRYLLTGFPTSYRLVGSGSLEIIPAPADNRSMRITYCPVSPTVNDVTVVIPGTDGFDQVVVLRTLIMTQVRQGRDSGDYWQMLNEVETRFKEGIKRRDRGAPRKLRDPRDAKYGKRRSLPPWR
jgi:hypothetical protein